MIDTKTLGAAAGIQRQDVTDRSAGRVIPTWQKAVIVGRFKRGRMDKPFTVTANNYQALLGDDPFNPSYTVVDDAFIAGASEVMVMRVGNPLGKPQVNVPVEPSDPINNPATVVIKGEARVGEALTAAVSDDDGLPKDIAYKWMADGIEVGTANAYKPTEADKGKRITIKVTFTDRKGFAEDVTSKATNPVQPSNKPASVIIKGTFRVGQTLINAITDANGVPSNITYKWMADGVEVGTASTYKIAEADKGKRISLQVRFIDNEGFSETATATAGMLVAALNKPASVDIYGDIRVGERITGVITDANGVPSDVAYQWFADGVKVGNVSSYTLTEADKGKRITLQVSFIDNDGFAESASGSTEPVKALNKPASVAINGIVKVGETLSATITDDNGVPSNIVYQWMIDGATVNTTSQYRLTESDKGKIVTLRVMFTDNEGFNESATSQPTEPVKALNKAASVAINGILRVGEVLTSIVTDTNGVPSDISYQWTADGIVIGESSSLTLTENEKGKAVSVRVSFIDNDGFEETAVSSNTAPIQALNKPASVTINGVVKVGETLTATITDANGVSSSVNHQWLVNGFYVGASARYTITERDKGGRVSVRVMFVDGDGFSENVLSVQTAPVSPINYPASVVIDGTLRVGETLTAIILDENGVPLEAAHKWLVNNIEVSTADSYELTEADEGGLVSVCVTFIDNDGFEENVCSEQSEPVQPSNKPASVVINGLMVVGETLSAIITDDNGIPTDIDYQWLADDIEVSVADQYELTEADEGKVIALRVTFVDNDGFAESVVSALGEPVMPAAPPTEPEEPPIEEVPPADE